MSTTVMAACWPLHMPPVAKAVLISLADNANDHGECWPSLSTICARTCFGRTAVIEAIRWLEDHGALYADRSNGRHTAYVVTPAQFDATGTPAEPVREPNRSATRTRPPRVPNPSASRTDPSATRTGPVRQTDTNRQEPSLKATVKNQNQSTREQVALPEWLPREAWADWIAYRKAGKNPMTPKACELSIRELTKLREQGHDPVAVIENAILRGWRGLYAPAGNGARASPGRPSAAETGFAQKHYTGTDDEHLPPSLR